MTDIVDEATRSRMMSGIKGKNTLPEVRLRRALHSMGFRFRLHVPDLSGRPDLCLTKHNAVIFVHGCFWHRHLGCRFATVPKSRTEFWQAKFESNTKRDVRNFQILQESGWRVAIIWECALRPKFLPNTIDAVSAWLKTSQPLLEIGEHGSVACFPQFNLQDDVAITRGDHQ